MLVENSLSDDVLSDFDQSNLRRGYGTMASAEIALVCGLKVWLGFTKLVYV